MNKGATNINPGTETVIISSGYLLFNEAEMLAYGAIEYLPSGIVANWHIDAAQRRIFFGKDSFMR